MKKWIRLSDGTTIKKESIVAVRRDEYRWGIYLDVFVGDSPSATNRIDVTDEDAVVISDELDKECSS